jgi:hypothetical protein
MLQQPKATTKQSTKQRNKHTQTHLIHQAINQAKRANKQTTHQSNIHDFHILSMLRQPNSINQQSTKQAHKHSNKETTR